MIDPTRPARQKRVLVIDDDADTARTLSLLLNEMGHDAAYATNGRAALQTAQELQPDFVFLDVGLPDLDGGTVARELRRLPGCDATVIIAITGLGDEHRLRMLSSGCDAFYMKPVESRMIEELLKR